MILAELTEPLEVLPVGDLTDHASGPWKPSHEARHNIDGIELPTGASPHRKKQ
jgi:hypothetical protein